MSAATTILERRKAPRLPTERLVYIDMGEKNGGMISNVSEGGLCFRATASVEPGETLDFSLSESGRRIGGKGKVVWTDATQKKGGLSLVKLSAFAREQIYCLITEPPSRGGAKERRGKSKATANRGNDKAMAYSSLEFESVSPRPVQDRLSRGFLSGLITGVLLSLLVMCSFLYRRQIGTVLIVLTTKVRRFQQKTSYESPAQQNQGGAPHRDPPWSTSNRH